MKRESLIFTVVMVALFAALGAWAIYFYVQNDRPIGSAYVEYIETYTDSTGQEWHVEEAATPEEAGEPNVHFSWSRTIGVWLGAIFTLFVLSFLYRDNPLYKFAEALVVGASAGYIMVLTFWTVIVPKLMGQLWPDLVQAHFLPTHEDEGNWWYVVPLILGLMLLMRLSPKGGWISRWPLAFIIGLTAGIRLIAYFQSDFVIQIQASIVSLLASDPSGDFSFWLSIRNLVVILGLLACLTYFFFSIEHKGVVGKTARVGIWVLMITFGAGFAYTVMGRITLLTQRLEFLFGDWLHLIT